MDRRFSDRFSGGVTAFYVQAAECAVFFCALNPPGSNGELSGGSYVHAAMNVIFLDIDGVLNCEDTPNPRKFPYIIDPRLLSLLKGLLARTGANVVLSSSWRMIPLASWQQNTMTSRLSMCARTSPRSPAVRRCLDGCLSTKA